jgi:uncharacterized membrane protein YcfT
MVAALPDGTHPFAALPFAGEPAVPSPVPTAEPDTPKAAARNAWVDAAKGLCIILVVLFHSTLGVEKDIGQLTWMNAVIEWARPFRMPDFFLISGLFLGARILSPWRSYLDSKVWHFVYFYLLWYHIHFALRLAPLVKEIGVEMAALKYLEGYVNPFGSLWFIYVLALYCIVVKLIRGYPAWLVTGIGLAAHVLAPHTGVFLVDEFLSRFVFFHVGHAYAPAILAYAGAVARLPLIIAALLLANWAIFNTIGLTTGWASARVLELGFPTRHRRRASSAGRRRR